MRVTESRFHPHRKQAYINEREVEVLLDTSSHFTLIKSSVAIRCRLQSRPVERPLFGIGSVTVPSMNIIGEAESEIIVDGVSAGIIVMLVVPDAVQRLDVIVGRSWLDSPNVAYAKEHNCIYIMPRPLLVRQRIQ